MNEQQEREAYINAHRHDWTMHKEADYWLSRISAAVQEERDRILRESAEVFHPYCTEPKNCYEKLSEIINKRE